MFIKTHLAITVFAILLFVNHVSSKLLFIIVALAATFLPDIDTAFSTLGKFKGFRFLQFFIRHRGLFHSFSFCIFVSILFAMFVPSIAFAFFLAYSLHLVADSFTIEGIKPFWPYNKTSSGKIRTGGKIETGIFVFFLLFDIFMIIFYIVLLLFDNLYLINIFFSCV